MTAKKISELTAATTPLAGTESLALVQSGTTKKATAQDVADLVDLSSYATQAYVDAALAGLSWKQAVRAATTAAGTLATDFENGDTVDGVTLATGDRILIKNQASAAENGIYVVAASGAPTRASDANSGAELVNATVYVSEGSTNADTQWTCTANATITIGVTNIVWAQLSAGASDASAVTYTPANAADWSGGTDPGNADDAIDQLAARVADLETGGGSTIGKHSIPIMAPSMQPQYSGGCGALTTEAGAAGQPDFVYLPFDSTTQEYAQFFLAMPKSWNEGTVTASFIWSHASTSGNFGVTWGLQAVAVGDGDSIAANYGTAQEVTDTGGTTNNLYRSAETPAITIAGTPAAEDTVFFRLYRKPADAGDTLSIDARLHGVVLHITTAAETDA